MRISEDKYFMDIAKLTAKRATCEKKLVGCVAVKDKRIIMSGYNGSPPGMDHCTDVGCYIHDSHCIRTVHAEMNIITQCAKQGISLQGATIYCTLMPCYLCLKLLINTGIEKVIYFEKKLDERTPEEIYQYIKLEQYKGE